MFYGTLKDQKAIYLNTNSQYSVNVSLADRSQWLIMSVLCVSGFPSGRVERVNPESQPLQPNYQASGAEVHPLPSSG